MKASILAWRNRSARSTPYGSALTPCAESHWSFAGLAMPLDPVYKVEGWTWAPGVQEIFQLSAAR